jgi:nitrogen fixation-related uncharacterized protein
MTFLALFILATKKNQYDDLDTPPIRMLFDDKTESDDDHGLGDDQHHS